MSAMSISFHFIQNWEGFMYISLYDFNNEMKEINMNQILIGWVHWHKIGIIKLNTFQKLVRLAFEWMIYHHLNQTKFTYSI